MPTALERFEAKVDRSPGHGPWGDCHLWTGKPTRKGYGAFWLGGNAVPAHRAAVILAGLAPGEDTHHRCEVKLCVNLEHLRGMAKPEHSTEHRRGQCARGHELTEDNVYVRPDNGKRMCRRCQRDRRARRYREVECAGRTI